MPPPHKKSLVGKPYSAFLYLLQYILHKLSCRLIAMPRDNESILRNVIAMPYNGIVMHHDKENMSYNGIAMPRDKESIPHKDIVMHQNNVNSNKLPK